MGEKQPLAYAALFQLKYRLRQAFRVLPEVSELGQGDIINERYRIESILGAGGMATVYRAVDLKAGSREVAVKILNEDQRTLPRRLNRFLREFAILSKLSHPNIIRVLDQSGTDAPVPCFSMELISGTPLSEVVARKDLSSEDVIPVLTAVASALEYIHSQGIIYCDLKPGNALLTNDNSIKLIDFGIAKELSQGEEESGKMLGTTYYMSPEQIRDEPLDVRTDIYSFGVFAFELIAGKPPFDSDAAFNVTASHLVGQVPSVRSVNKDTTAALDRMIRVCMEKDRQNRYATMTQIRERLEAAQNAKGKGWFSRIFG